MDISEFESLTYEELSKKFTNDSWSKLDLEFKSKFLRLYFDKMFKNYTSYKPEELEEASKFMIEEIISKPNVWYNNNYYTLLNNIIKSTNVVLGTLVLQLGLDKESIKKIFKKNIPMKNLTNDLIARKRFIGPILEQAVSYEDDNFTSDNQILEDIIEEVKE